VARGKPIQTNFGAGELAPEYWYRQDATQYGAGAKSLLNCRILVGGGVRDRPGSWRLPTLPDDARLFDWVVNESTAYVIAISSGRMDAYLPDGTPAGNLTGCPWTGTIWQSLVFKQSGDTAFITHADMPVQQVSRTGASSWARAAYAFAAGPAGRIEQPYYKFAPSTATLQPSARTGSITLTSSVAWFTAAYVGQRLRYVGREILITGYTSPTVVTGTVTEELPKTQQLVMTTSMGFSVGDVVEGSVSGARGKVTAVVNSTTIQVVLIDALTAFVGLYGGAAKEMVIGPTGKGEMSSTGNVTDVTLAATDEWDEQVFGPVWGYPSCCEIHRARLLFGGHKALPGALFGSKPDSLYDHNVGKGNDGDAIFETIGDAGAAAIIQLHSNEQLIVMTDKGAYYVPEAQNAPFRPSGMAFFPFGNPWPVGRAPARAFDGGVLMASGSLIIKARPTGDNTRAWMADEVSLLADHLLNSPVDLAVASNVFGASTKYAFAVNADGSMAVLQLVEAQEIRNMVPWKTAGSYRSVCCIGSNVFACVRRVIAGAPVHLLERFDVTTTLDATISYADATALADWQDDFGDTAVDIITADLRYALGAPPLEMEEPPAGPYLVGLRPSPDFEVETLPPIVDVNGVIYTGEEMRILRAWVQAKDSARFAAMGTELTAYLATDHVDQPPAKRSGPQVFEALGWKIEPTVRITRADPLPICILGIKMEVAV
jgi:hypothetical protein